MIISEGGGHPQQRFGYPKFPPSIPSALNVPRTIEECSLSALSAYFCIFVRSRFSKTQTNNRFRPETQMLTPSQCSQFYIATCRFQEKLGCRTRQIPTQILCRVLQPLFYWQNWIGLASSRFEGVLTVV